MSDRINDIIRWQSQLADGSRLYVVDIPIKECYRERKIFEIAIVHCKNETRLDYDKNRELIKEEIVEATYAYLNAQRSTFCSYTTYQAKTDIDAVWQAMRDRYHRP